MHAVVIIPARYASRRFPGKPLARIMGKPLIEHVYGRALKAANVRKVIVATDDERIRDTVIAFGGLCVMTGTEHRSGSDRLGEVAAGLDADVIVNVQGDEPLIDPSVIDAVIAAHAQGRAREMATVAVPMETLEDYQDRHIVKVVTDEKGFALYFSRSPIPYGWQGEPGGALRHIGIYAYTRRALLDFVSLTPGVLEKREDLEQLRALENGMSIFVVKVPPFKAAGVDRPEDIARVEDVMKEIGSLDQDPSAGKRGGGA